MQKIANTKSVEDYHKNLKETEREVCELLHSEINKSFKKVKGVESKIWHGSPVWFIEGNPVVAYSKQKKGIKLMFFSGASFDDDKLELGSGKFKDAGIFYNSVKEIVKKDLKNWLTKAVEIQWDYKNVIKNKGKLVKIK